MARVLEIMCPGCSKPILKGEDKFLHANDRPYINLWWHRVCFKTATDEERLEALHNAEVIRWTKER